jgi:quercetin dioxygenase-like cupin family protein
MKRGSKRLTLFNRMDVVTRYEGIIVNMNFPRAGESENESAKEFLKYPGVIFARELADVPGKYLVVVALEFPPKPSEPSKSPQRYIGHRHPGSVYVHVIKGTVRLGIDGQPVQVVHAGESFFEAVGALHTVAESASTTEPASAIAVLIVPDGAPILTPVEGQTK